MDSASLHKPRLDFIDSLRAIAILLVFVRHSSEVFVGYGHGSRLIFNAARGINAGELGVIVFFAISGFLIPSSFKGDRVGGSVRYVLSRVFRLYPAFLISVIPSAATHYWMGGVPFSWHNIAVNCTMVPRLFGAPLANGAYWTLEVEAAFYLLCLILFVGGVLHDAFIFAAILLLTCCLFESSQRILFGGLLNPPLLGTSFVFFLNIGVMCWGAICRAWWGRNRLNAITAIIFWGFAFSWIVYRPLDYLGAISHGRHSDYDTNFLCAYGIGLAVFLGVVAYGRLRSPVLLWIGRISYSLYLFHGDVIHTVQYLINHHPILQGYPSDLYSLIALLMALAVAQLSFWLIERPGIRLGRKITRVLLDGRINRVDWRHAIAAIPVLFARPTTTQAHPGDAV